MKECTIREYAEKWGISERRATMLCREGRIFGAYKVGKCWCIPADAAAPLDGRTKEYAEREKTPTQMFRKESEDGQVLFAESGARSRVLSVFENTYRRHPDDVVFTPYRVCPLGAHIDHQNGRITGFAIDKGIYIAYGAKQNGIIELSSLQFPKRAQWHIGMTPKEKQGDWADHLRGATLVLAERFPLHVGLSAVIDGELPIGGLSSSAAVILTFLSAICKLNGIRLSPSECIEVAREAENRYVGVACGKLDQSCEVYCRKDALLYMDMKDDAYERIAAPETMEPFEIAIFFSGLERSLASSKFNTRVDECRAAAYSLLAYAGLEYGKLAATGLREVPYEIFLQYSDKLPPDFKKRCEHYYGEMSRVEAGVRAWRKGDIREFGKQVFASGLSSIEKWETGSKELITLYRIMTETDGIYGGRFSGAGFKGCCMALIDPSKRESILEKVEREYLTAFPELKGKYSAHICHTADGVNLE